MEKKHSDFQSLNYAMALSELKEIAKRLDNEALDLDEIEKSLIRAEALSNFCKESLRRVSDRLSAFQETQIIE